MRNFTLYSPFRQWKKGDPLSSPYVHLSIGTHSVSKEHILLSPRLMTDGEVDETVERLKEELEEFRKKAKKELRDLRAKIREV